MLEPCAARSRRRSRPGVRRVLLTGGR
jgi:hypothetical protein